MPMNKIAEHEKEQMIKLSDDAFGEFLRDGRVMTIFCHVCSGLIEFRALSPTAWQSTCPCGKYNGTWRGL